MDTALLTLAFCALGYALLLSIALTVVLILIMIKLKKSKILEFDSEEEVPENECEKEDNNCDNTEELIRINYMLVDELRESDRRLDELISVLEETDHKLKKLIEEHCKESSRSAELERKLSAEIGKNKELTSLLSRLEEEKQSNPTPSDPNNEACKKIEELEELVKYKDNYYSETLRAEKKLRAGVCDAINSLVQTRGSNSTEYLEEQIEAVIKLLDASRDRR